MGTTEPAFTRVTGLSLESSAEWERSHTFLSNGNIRESRPYRFCNSSSACSAPHPLQRDMQHISPLQGNNESLNLLDWWGQRVELDTNIHDLVRNLTLPISFCRRYRENSLTSAAYYAVLEDLKLAKDSHEADKASVCFALSAVPVLLTPCVRA